MQSALIPPVMPVSELDRIAAEARTEAQQSSRAPRSVAVLVWAFIALDLLIAVWRLAR